MHSLGRRLSVAYGNLVKGQLHLYYCIILLKYVTLLIQILYKNSLNSKNSSTVWVCFMYFLVAVTYCDSCALILTFQVV